MGPQRCGDDPLLERVPLDRHGPFVFDRDQPLTFRAVNGIHWLLLDSVYSGCPRRGGPVRTVHLVRPTDLDLGGGMDTFAEDLAERIRTTDPDAVAIFSYWPLDQVGSAERTRTRWLSFSAAHGPRRGGLGIVEVAEQTGSMTVRSHHAYGSPSRYRDVGFWHLGFDELSSRLGVQVTAETLSEVDRRAAAVPGWDVLVRTTQQANKDADEAFLAQLGEWGVGR